METVDTANLCENAKSMSEYLLLHTYTYIYVVCARAIAAIAPNLFVIALLNLRVMDKRTFSSSTQSNSRCVRRTGVSLNQTFSARTMTTTVDWQHIDSID